MGVRGWLERRGIWWHGQNLKAERRRPRPWYMFDRRGWLHIGRACIHAQLCILDTYRWLGVKWSRGGVEQDYGLSIGVVVAALYMHIEGVRPYDALPRDWSRTWGIALHGWDLHVEWCYNSAAWDKRDRGRSRVLFLKDKIFGRAKHGQQVLQMVPAYVQMPEGAYPCTVELVLRTWKRPRLPWMTRRRSAYVHIPGGIPIPGKGENSWDCGDDAILGHGTSAITVDEALASVRASALSTRERRGGRNWKPAAGWKVQA